MCGVGKVGALDVKRIGNGLQGKFNVNASGMKSALSVLMLGLKVFPRVYIAIIYCSLYNTFVYMLNAICITTNQLEHTDKSMYSSVISGRSEKSEDIQ